MLIFWRKTVSLIARSEVKVSKGVGALKGILIKNVRIWTNVLECGGEAEFLDDGFVQIKDDTIERVGTMRELLKQAPKKRRAPDGVETLDGAGQLLMPGLINCHTHLYSALARGMMLKGVAPYSFRDILEQVWWRLDKALDPESIYYSALIGGIDMLKNGITTIIDHHASPNSILGSLNILKRALVDELGLRACLCYEISDRDGKERARQGIEENIAFFDYAQKAKDDRLSAMIGLHASFTISDETFALLQRELKVKFGERLQQDDRFQGRQPFSKGKPPGYHLHAAEGSEDSQDAHRRYGKRAVERLHDQGILGENTIIAHGIHLTEAEKDILAQQDTIVVHSPQSNMNNAVGITDVTGLLHRGVLVGLGNDGFGSNLLDDLKAMYLVHKFAHRDPKILDMGQAHRIFFQNNYAIVKRLFNIDVGKIKPGYKADLILVDYTPPTPLAGENFMGHVIFGLASSFNVRTVFVNGKIVMHDGKIHGVDAEEAFAASCEVARKLWRRIR